MEALYAALALNRSLTELMLPIFFKQGGPGQGGPWVLDALHCRHVSHMLRSNSTVKRLTLYATIPHVDDSVPGAGKGGEGGDHADATGVDALKVDTTTPASSALLAPSSTNSSLEILEFLFTKPWGDDGRMVLTSDDDDGGDDDGVATLLVTVQAEEVVNIITQVHAVRQLLIRRLGPPHVHVNLAWSENALRIFKHTLSTTDTLKSVNIGLDSPPALVDCFSHNCGTVTDLLVALDGHGCEALFKLLTPTAAAPASTCGISNSLKRLHLFHLGNFNGSQGSPDVDDLEEQQHREREVVALVAMMVRNTSLEFLWFICCPSAKYSVEQWATAIIPALAHNRALLLLVLT